MWEARIRGRYFHSGHKMEPTGRYDGNYGRNKNVFFWSNAIESMF